MFDFEVSLGAVEAHLMQLDADQMISQEEQTPPKTEATCVSLGGTFERQLIIIE